MDKTFTLREIIKAIRKNGLPKTKRVYYSKDENGKVIGGCALGQAAINLKVRASHLDSALGGIGSVIAGKNDHTDMTLPEIADYLTERYDLVLDSMKVVLEK